MFKTRKDVIRVTQHWQGIFAALGLDARKIFDDPRIKSWRRLSERDNAVMDVVGPSGQSTRLHFKRFQKAFSPVSPAEMEVRGHLALTVEKIPTLNLVGWGTLIDGRSFTVTEDLTGYQSAQSLLRKGFPFSQLAQPTAELASRLHRAGLHHCDLYLCHFFIRESDLDCRIIDVARVARLPVMFARRWIVKDLAQFRYSGREFGISDAAMDLWLDEYAALRKIEPRSLLKAIKAKTETIARHDGRLSEREPTRNISIPDELASRREKNGSNEIMKVLLVIFHAQAKRGGAERYTRDLASKLSSLNVTVVTAATDFEENWPGEKRPLPASGLTRSWQYSNYLDSLDRLLATEAFDVVHAMLPVRRCDLYHPHAGIAAQPKRAGLAEHLNRRRRSMGAVERDLLSSADGVRTICLSNYVLGQFRSVYPDAPAEILLNGIDTARFNPADFAEVRQSVRDGWGVADGELALLCVAQDFQRKGVPVAVEALAQLRDLSARLIVVGRDDPAPVSKLARSLGVESRVLFHGPVSDPRPAYAGADLFVLPTHHDPCSLVAIEALAMGVPVISTRFNGATEWMTNGTHGQILSAVDAAGLASAIRALASPAERAAASAACLDLRETLDVTHHVAALMRLYTTATKE